MSTYLVCTLCVVGGILLGVLAYGLINMAAENEKARRQTEVLLKEKEELEEKHKRIQELEQANNDYHIFFSTHEIPEGASNNVYIKIHQEVMKQWEELEMKDKFSAMETYVESLIDKYQAQKVSLSKTKTTPVSLDWVQKMQEAEHGIDVASRDLIKLRKNIENYTHFNAAQRAKFLANLNDLAWSGFASEKALERLSADTALA